MSRNHESSAAVAAPPQALELTCRLVEAMTQPAALFAGDAQPLARSATWRDAPVANAVSRVLGGAPAWTVDAGTERGPVRVVGITHDGLRLALATEEPATAPWRDLARQSEQFDAVTRALAAFVEGGDFCEAGQILLRSALSECGASCGLVAGCADGDRVRVMAHDGVTLGDPTDTAAMLGDSRASGFTLPRDAFAAVLDGRAPLIWSEGDDADGIQAAVIAGLGVRTMLALPLLRGSTVVGLLVIGNRDGGFDEGHAAGAEVLTRATGVMLDAAQRREREAELERQLRAAQRLEGIGRLAGGIAHDFNNLLTVIMGLSECVRDDLGQDDPSAKSLQHIFDAAGRAASLTRQLLAFSRRQVLQPVIVDVNDIVTSMDPMLRRLVPENIELLNTLRPDAGHVKADVAQLEQVLMNLVINARDARPSGGRIFVETAAVELDRAYARRHVGARTGPHVLLAVSDTGTGMDHATRARIFEPFFTTKEPGKGTGLGLATVYGIVKQSGGWIWVYSEPGYGSTFKVYLPCVEPAGDARPAGADAAGRGGTETVLVVEDQEELRHMVVQALRRQGYKVLHAGNGLEALRTIEGGAPVDLLLTDVVMPGLDGPDLAARLRAERPGLPIVFMSGYSETVLALQGPRVMLLEKPFALTALARTVRSALDSE